MKIQKIFENFELYSKIEYNRIGLLLNQIKEYERGDIKIDPVKDYEKLSKDIWKNTFMIDYKTPRNYFLPKQFKSFKDFFLRTIKPNIMLDLIKKSDTYKICSPCEGSIKLKHKNVVNGDIRLKRSVWDLKDLLKVLKQKDLIQFSLYRTDYHIVHSPVDGKIINISQYKEFELSNQSESMCIIDIQTKDIGIITIVAIGEMSIQSFILDESIKINAQLKKLDKIGHFWFGSQIIIASDHKLDINVKHDDRVFPGDLIL